MVESNETFYNVHMFVAKRHEFNLALNNCNVCLHITVYENKVLRTSTILFVEGITTDISYQKTKEQMILFQQVEMLLI